MQHAQPATDPTGEHCEDQAERSDRPERRVRVQVRPEVRCEEHLQHDRDGRRERARADARFARDDAARDGMHERHTQECGERRPGWPRRRRSAEEHGQVPHELYDSRSADGETRHPGPTRSSAYGQRGQVQEREVTEQCAGRARADVQQQRGRKAPYERKRCQDRRDGAHGEVARDDRRRRHRAERQPRWHQAVDPRRRPSTEVDQHRARTAQRRRLGVVSTPLQRRERAESQRPRDDRDPIAQRRSDPTALDRELNEEEPCEDERDPADHGSAADTEPALPVDAGASWALAERRALGRWVRRRRDETALGALGLLTCAERCRGGAVRLRSGALGERFFARLRCLLRCGRRQRRQRGRCGIGRGRGLRGAEPPQLALERGGALLRFTQALAVARDPDDEDQRCREDPRSGEHEEQLHSGQSPPHTSGAVARFRESSREAARIDPRQTRGGR